MPPKPLRRLAGQCLGHLMIRLKVPSGLQRLAMRPCSTPRENRPTGPGWEWSRKARFQSLLGCSCSGHHIRSSRGAVAEPAELDAVRTRQRAQVLLGGIANVVVANGIYKGQAQYPKRSDACRSVLSRLPGDCANSYAAQPAKHYLARISAVRYHASSERLLVGRLFACHASTPPRYQ